MGKTKQKIKFINLSKFNQEALIKRTSNESDELSNQIKKLSDMSSGVKVSALYIAELKKILYMLMKNKVV